MARAFWVSLILARTIFFLINTMPNTSEFHLLALTVKFMVASKRPILSAQALWTTIRNSGWSSHIVWKWNGLLDASRGGLNKSTNTGQWSKQVQGRCVIVASGYIILHSGLAKHMSIFSNMRFEIGLLLVQVNLGPIKPRSIILQLSRQSLNSKALLMFTCLPTYLSSPLSRYAPLITFGLFLLYILVLK